MVDEYNEKRVKRMGFLRNRGTDRFSARVITVNGRITAAQQRLLADAAELFGDGTVLFTTRLTVEIPGIPYEKIEEFRSFIEKEGLTTGGTDSLVRPVVACKGSTCQYGLLDTYRISEEIHRRFYLGYHTVKLPHKLKIAVGGCPNNCVKPDLNDIGLVGQRIPAMDKDACMGCKKCAVEKVCPMQAVKLENRKAVIDPAVCNNCGRCIGTCMFDAVTEDTYGYKLYLGGRWGKRPNQGQAMEKIFTSEEEVLDVIEKAILLYREQGKSGERFARTIERLGFAEVEKQLLGRGLMERKEEILAAQLHLSGGATC